MKFYLILFFPLLLPFIAISSPQKILFVASNVNEFNNAPNGTYLMEIAIPFDYFDQKNFEIDIVSPKGGKIALYHKGDTSQELKTILFSQKFIEKTSRSITPDEIIPSEYCAVIYPGGYGQFVDVCMNATIAGKVAMIYQAGGIIGSVGHGAASLVNIKLKNKKYLVQNKTMTCFPSWCEKEYMSDSDYGRLLPFDMQQELERRGAIVKVILKGDTDESKQYVLDSKNRIVTASFADGGSFVAQEVYRMLLAR